MAYIFLPICAYLDEKRMGVPYLSVDFMRAWMSDSFDVTLLRAYIQSDAQAASSECLACILCPKLKMRCAVKIGSLWFEVDVIFGAQHEHILECNSCHHGV